LTPADTALRVEKGRDTCCARSWAKLVLPTPGGPHKRSEGSLPASSAGRKAPLGPTIWVCPTYSVKDLGRMRSARLAILPKFGGLESQSKQRKVQARGIFGVNLAQCNVQLVYCPRIVRSPV
jgi:hypothetical protein